MHERCFWTLTTSCIVIGTLHLVSNSFNLSNYRTANVISNISDRIVADHRYDIRGQQSVASSAQRISKDRQPNAQFNERWFGEIGQFFSETLHRSWPLSNQPWQQFAESAPLCWFTERPKMFIECFCLGWWIPLSWLSGASPNLLWAVRSLRPICSSVWSWWRVRWSASVCQFTSASSSSPCTGNWVRSSKWLQNSLTSSDVASDVDDVSVWLSKFRTLVNSISIAGDSLSGSSAFEWSFI